MEMISENNYIRLCGTVKSSPVLSHVTRSKQFYTFPLEVYRLSGTADVINVILREDMLSELPAAGERAEVEGEIRTFNNRSGEGAKLVITVFARRIDAEAFDDENYTGLRGILCKPTMLRTTPMGRDICDIMLAVNRRYGRSDYIPCICWGQKAREAAEWSVGDRIELTGRLQSRQYIKVTDEESVERIAFEVSANDIRLAEEEKSLVL